MLKHELLSLINKSFQMVNYSYYGMNIDNKHIFCCYNKKIDRQQKYKRLFDINSNYNYKFNYKDIFMEINMELKTIFFSADILNEIYEDPNFHQNNKSILDIVTEWINDIKQLKGFVVESEIGAPLWNGLILTGWKQEKIIEVYNKN